MNSRRQMVKVGMGVLIVVLLGMMLTHCTNTSETKSVKSEFMEETMMDKKTQKIGVICSIVQIILSIICLIYSAINQETIIMWVLFLCSGILSLSSNISRNNKKEDE